MPSREVTFGVGTAALLDCDAELVLREFHPTSHAGFQLRVTVQDDVVTSADPRVGFMHRGSEKLFESRDYRQLMMLANRHDWYSAFANELVIALALESATGITPPERATWARTLLAEANRVSTLLAFLGAVIERPQAAFAARDVLAQAQEVVTGSRVHPMFTRIGGIAAPVSADGLAAYASAVDVVRDGLAALSEQVADYASSLTGLAALTREAAIDFGASGAVARASGLDLDVRRDHPYAGYGELTDLLAVPVARAGDAQARYEVLLAQLPTSLSLMSACIDRLRELGDGPHDVLLPKTVRAPEGTTYQRVEGPLGTVGCLVVSDGDKMPWRLKIRTASFAHAQALTEVLVGVPAERLADALMSMFLVVGDIDR